MSYGVEYDVRPKPALHADLPRVGRHRKPEPASSTPPSMNDEHARPIPALVAEAKTEFIRYPSWAAPASLPMPLPARKEGAALVAESAPRPMKPRIALLGQLLQGARAVFGIRGQS